MSKDCEEDEDSADVQLACVGLHVLTLCLILHPETLSNLHKDKTWQEFIVDTILICKNRWASYSLSRPISNKARFTVYPLIPMLLASDLCIVLQAGEKHGPRTVSTRSDESKASFLHNSSLLYRNGEHSLALLFVCRVYCPCTSSVFTLSTWCNTVMQDKVPIYASQSGEYFSLLCHLLNWAQMEQPLARGEDRLTDEIKWLKKTRVCVNNLLLIVSPFYFVYTVTPCWDSSLHVVLPYLFHCHLSPVTLTWHSPVTHSHLSHVSCHSHLSLICHSHLSAVALTCHLSVTHLTLLPVLALP